MDPAAIRLAIDLLHAPSRVRIARARPLPGGVLLLLRVAARDEGAEAEAVRVSGRSQAVVRDAATFFVEQVLLNAESDSYRTLGGDRRMTTAELRRNMALILRCVHPDVVRDRDCSAGAARVTRAWDNLKTPQRRALYDESLRGARARASAAESAQGATVGRVRRQGALASVSPASVRRRARRVEPAPRRGSLLRVLSFLLGRVLGAPSTR
jgi:hypothetical protein